MDQKGQIRSVINKEGGSRAKGYTPRRDITHERKRYRDTAKQTTEHSNKHRDNVDHGKHHNNERATRRGAGSSQYWSTGTLPYQVRGQERSTREGMVSRGEG